MGQGMGAKCRHAAQNVSGECRGHFVAGLIIIDRLGLEASGPSGLYFAFEVHTLGSSWRPDPVMRVSRLIDLPSVLLWCVAIVGAVAVARAQSDVPNPSPDDVEPETALQNEFEPIFARIDRLSLEGGRYNPELSEARMALGLAYRRAGQREQAARAFAEAAVVLRANQGLHELGQMRYLDLLAEEYTALAWVDRLVAVHRQMYWLHQNAWGASDPRLLPVIERIVRGQTGLTSENGPEMVTAGSDLINRLMDDWLEISESAFGGADPRLIESHYARSLVYYDIARSASRGITVRADARRDMYRLRRRVVDFETSGSGPEGPMGNPLQLAVERAERGGREALEAVVEAFSAGWERDPKIFTEPLAVALIHLGDWNVLFGAPGSRRQYRQAHELLSQTPNGSARHGELFRRAPILPATVRFSQYSTSSAVSQLAAQQPTIEVSFDVTTRGRGQNFEVTRAAPGLEEAADVLIEILAGQRFRPALQDDKLVEQRVTRRFVRTGAESFVQLDRRPEHVDSAALAAIARPAEVAAGAPL